MLQDIVEREKAKEIPTDVWIERVKVLQSYYSGEWFTVNDITKNLKGASRGTACRVLSLMRDRGLLDDELVAHGKRCTTYYRRRMSQIDWRRHDWGRKHTNKQLGIQPDRLGMVGR